MKNLVILTEKEETPEEWFKNWISRANNFVERLNRVGIETSTFDSLRIVNYMRSVKNNFQKYHPKRRENKQGDEAFYLEALELFFKDYIGIDFGSFVKFENPLGFNEKPDSAFVKYCSEYSRMWREERELI